MASESNHPPDETSARRNHYVKEWRDFMGWTQEELAEMAHVSLSKISRLENSKRGLKADFLQVLGAIFGVQGGALLEVNPATEEGARTAHMLQAWNLLTSSQQSDVLKMIQSLVPPNDKDDDA